MSKLPALSQEYFDDNRERFEAETTTSDVQVEKHPHDIYRKTGVEFGCRHCSVGWIDPTGQIVKYLASK